MTSVRILKLNFVRARSILIHKHMWSTNDNESMDEAGNFIVHYRTRKSNSPYHLPRHVAARIFLTGIGLMSQSGKKG